MNLYLVVSEELQTRPPIGGFEPAEWYRICELVVARSHSHARWLAWQVDNVSGGSYTGNVLDMPRFTVQQKRFDFEEGPARVLSDEEVTEIMKRWPWMNLWQLHHDAPQVGLEADV